MQDVTGQPVGHRVSAATIRLEAVDMADRHVAQAPDGFVLVRDGRNMADLLRATRIADRPAAEQQPVLLGSQPIDTTGNGAIELYPWFEFSRVQPKHGEQSAAADIDIALL